MATIDDVAKKAGVSKGTVSSVFSKKRPISHEVTERVLSVAKELAYYPHHVARSLAIKKTMIAGLKIPLSRDGSMSAFESQMINGVIKECSKQGYRVLLDTLPDQDDPTQFSIDPVDGVILLNPRTQDPRIERYNQMRIPLVLVGRPDPLDERISFVDNNNEDLGYQVARYLLEKGHTSILFLNSSLDMTVSFDREKGVAKAFAEKNVYFDKKFIKNYSRTIFASPTEYGYSSLLSTYNAMQFTAIITDTDRVALGVLRAAREIGIEIPDQLSVVALSNDAVLAQETTPKLTAVELFAETLGVEAAKILLKKINDMSIIDQKIVEANLIIRKSCKVRGEQV